MSHVGLWGAITGTGQTLREHASWALPYVCGAIGRLPLLSRVQSLTLATPCAPQVIARAVLELKYLVSFAITTIAVANHTRKVVDEAHCRMQAANIAAAPSLLARVGRLLKAEKLNSGEDVGGSSPGSSNITNCLAEKAARLTYGWDLNDQEVDVYFLVIIGLVVAIHFIAFVIILCQAIKEKPVAGCHSNWEPNLKCTTLAYLKTVMRSHHAPVPRSVTDGCD